MSTIQGSIMLMDAMSTPLTNIVGAINTTISALQNINNTNVNIDTTRLASAQTMIVNAGAELAQVEREIQTQIDRNTQAQNGFNNAIQNGITKSNSLFDKIKSFIGLYAGIKAVKVGLETSDNLAQTTARLDLINDGKQTTEQLQEAIFQSAKNSRAGFMDTASVVSKLGLLAPQAFNGNIETVKFAELMAKSFKVGGAGQQEQTAGMYQLTQAMASGRLQGDEFRSVMENAPMLAQAISKYTGKSIGALKDMSKEGLITSDVIKNSLFAMSDEINAKFDTIPRTFSDVMTDLKSNATKSFMGISQTMSGIFNSERFQNFMNGVAVAIDRTFQVINWLIKGISAVGTVLYEIWIPIQPILFTVLGLLTAYKVAMGLIAVKTAIASGITAIYNLALLAQQTMQGAVNIALAKTTAAQWGLNIAMLACPITWIIVGIALVIAAIYGVVAVYNKWTGSTKSATGYIVGAFYWMAGLIYNTIAGIWNGLAGLFVSIYNFGVSIAEFFANVFKSPIKAVAHLFGDFINFLVGKAKFIGTIIDTICGTDVVGKLKGVQDGINSWINDKVGVNDIQLKRMDATNIMMDRTSLKGMFNKGYVVGDNMSKWGENLFNNPAGEFNPEAVESKNLLKNIDKNTQKSNDLLDLSHDEISYLRDLAEREAINKFTTAEVKVEVGGINQNVNSTLDLDDVANYLTNKLGESLAVAAEGTYE